MKPLVSILIPAYNAEKWLAETLRSALDQTWDNKEIVVVDDGSKDGTLALARTFESSIVKVFTHVNQGASATRNKAFSLCHGDYIQWLDADDLLAPDKIARQMEALDDAPDPRLLLSAEWGSFMHRPSRTKFIPSGLWCSLSKAEWLLRKLEQNVYMQTATWLVSRELALAAGLWDTRLLGDDDGEYFCRVLMASDGVRFVPGSKVYYRQAGSGSLSYVGSSDKKRDAQWISMELHMSYLRSLDDSQRARAACVKFMQNWMVAFYPERLDIFDKAQTLSRDFGGQIEAPTLNWKFSWIKTLFGWHFARRAQLRILGTKWSLLSFCDKALCQFERRGPMAQSSPNAVKATQS
jgi:glycosyltransferase involved in cell wall biosynthesis